MSEAEQAVLIALQEISGPVEQRVRLRLRAAMRKVGLDEWKVAWLLNFKIHCLAQSTKSGASKLLLDYLKEAARHLDPASVRAAAQQMSPFEMFHEATRQDFEDRDGA